MPANTNPVITNAAITATMLTATANTHAKIATRIAARTAATVIQTGLVKTARITHKTVFSVLFF